MQIGQFRVFTFLLLSSMLIFLPVKYAMANGFSVSDSVTNNILMSQDKIRVVTLFQGATDSVIALGLVPVGVVDSWGEKPIYDYLSHVLKSVPHVGLETQPNIEAIMMLKPDLIIGAKSRHEKIHDQLSQIAPTVMTDNVYDFKASLDLTAKALSEEFKGKQVWKHFQERIENLRDGIEKSETSWPLTASVLNIRADHLRLYLQQSFSGAVLKEVGFKFPLPNKTGWGVKLKTKEALPSVNADVFFIILHSSDPAVRQNYNAWRSHPLWQILDAPKHKQVHKVDRVAWLLSGGILGANLMLDQLYQIYTIPRFGR